VDWQCAQLGTWSWDVSYHIAAVLDVEERRKSETALLAHYLDRLEAHGAPAPSWDVAWDAYRRSVVYGFNLWAISEGHYPDAIPNEFVRRLGTAVADHESFELLGV
jgi:hypothetical protein